MQGQFFVSVTPRGDTKGSMNVQTGFVLKVFNEAHLLLQFDGAKFNYKRVVPVAALGGFSFFNTQSEQQEALAELLGRNQPEAGEAVQ